MQPLRPKRRHQRDVEITTWVIAQGQRDLKGHLRVTHGHSYGELAARGGPLCGWKIEIWFRRVGGRFAFVLAAYVGIVEFEVGGCEGGEGEEGELHDG